MVLGSRLSFGLSPIFYSRFGGEYGCHRDHDMV